MEPLLCIEMTSIRESLNSLDEFKDDGMKTLYKQIGSVMELIRGSSPLLMRLDMLM